MYKWKSGHTFIGTWLDGVKTGPGVWEDPNRERYEGNFQNGKFDGPGVYT